MLIKKKNKQNLERFNPRFIDFGKNSPNFFNITSIPDAFSSGKNVIKFRPYQHRFRGTDPILIEILDFNGDPIYYEILDYRDSDGSLVMAIYIYEDTPPGNCTITFLGTSLFDENLKPLNPNEITAYNFRHRLLLYVDPLRRNDSEIIYLNAPTLSVKERKYFIVEQKFSGSRIVSTSGTASFSITDNTYRFTSEGTEFSKYFESGIVKIKDL